MYCIASLSNTRPRNISHIHVEGSLRLDLWRRRFTQVGHHMGLCLAMTTGSKILLARLTGSELLLADAASQLVGISLANPVRHWSRMACWTGCCSYHCDTPASAARRGRSAPLCDFTDALLLWSAYEKTLHSSLPTFLSDGEDRPFIQWDKYFKSGTIACGSTTSSGFFFFIIWLRMTRALGKLENTYLYLFAFIIKKAKKKLHVLFRSFSWKEGVTC
jgi:hypothetical protein